MADEALPGATGRDDETEAEQAWPVQVTTLQMHEVRTGLLILSLATERLRRRRGDDDVVADTVVLVRRALARIMAIIEAWAPPSPLHGVASTDGPARRATHGATAATHSDVTGLKAEFDIVVAELARLQPPESYPAEREALYHALDHLYADLLATLHASGR